MAKTVKSRLKEPSTWAGLGIIAHSIAGILATSGSDPASWAGLFAGASAALMSDK